MSLQLEFGLQGLQPEETVMLERAREKKGRQGGFSRTQLDDISLSAHHAIYLLTAYCTTTTSEQYNYVCK